MPTSSNSRRLGRLAICVFVAAGLLQVVGPSAPTKAEGVQGGPVTKVGSLSRMPDEAVARFGPGIVPNSFFDPVGSNARNSSLHTEMTILTGTLLAVPEARQLWQFFPFTDRSKTGILVYDLDSMRPIHSFIYPGRFLRPGSLNSAGEWVHAIDGAKRVFLVNIEADKIIEFDLQTFESRVRPMGPPRAGPLMALMGMTYDLSTDSLVLLFGLTRFTYETQNFIARMGLTDGAWQIRLLRSCDAASPAAGTSAYDLPILATKDWIYVVCHRAGFAGAVVRLPRATAFDATPTAREDAVVGPVYIRTALVDAAAQRIYLITLQGEIWAFDTDVMAFVGVIAAHGKPTPAPNGYGIDTLSGQLFFQSEHFGFGIADGRFFPIPQARTFPEIAGQGQERIFTDPKTRRVFLLQGVDLYKVNDYSIYQVAPAPTPPAPPDPDRNTIDMAEGSATEGRYFASGSGYGVRALMAKGLTAVLPAPSVGVLSPTGLLIDQHVNSKCGFTDRELVAGRVAKAEYDTGSAAAKAMAVDVDDRTKQDLRQLARCDASVKVPSRGDVLGEIFSLTMAGDPGREWKYEPASCSSSVGGNADESDGENHGEQPLGSNQVSCPLPGGELLASATADLVGGGVSVGRAFTTTKISKGADGVTTSVEAYAQNIDIAGTIQIAEVYSIATSRSNGRPSKVARSSYQPGIRGVRIAGRSICGAECDFKTVIDELNSAAAGRAQFRIASGIDARLLEGSPKGSLTAVQKSVQRQVSDQALIGDFTNEVPALEMLFYNDNTNFGRARQLYQFAGAAAAATYNIVLKPTGDPGDDDGVLTDVLGPGGLEPGGLLDAIRPIALSERPVVNGSTKTGDGGLPSIPEILTAIGRGIRVFFESPRQMMLLLTAWALFGLPVWLSRRRRLLLATER